MPVDDEAAASRLRGVIMLRAACDTVLERFDCDDLNDLSVAVRVGDLRDILDEYLEHAAHMRHTAA